MEGVQALIGLGSNLGDREAFLNFAVSAVAELPGLSINGLSRIYESDAVGPGEQGRYLNAAIEVQCTRTPVLLLASLLRIEIEAGRDRSAAVEAWSPRTLDLDLLFYGETCLEQEGLSLPHPRLHERAFVLEPLCDLVPKLIHPVQNETIAELTEKLRKTERIEVWPRPLNEGGRRTCP